MPSSPKRPVVHVLSKATVVAESPDRTASPDARPGLREFLKQKRLAAQGTTGDFGVEILLSDRVKQWMQPCTPDKASAAADTGVARVHDACW